MIAIAIVILFVFLFVFVFSEAKEHFYLIGQPTRNTRNMSYDKIKMKNYFIINNYMINLLNFPEILNQWDYEKNKNINPFNIEFKSMKVWWKCNKVCGNHSWITSINSRINGSNCPFCCNKKICPCKCNSIEKTHSHILSKWDYIKNINIKPDEVSKGSTKKVWWKCNKECGNHSYFSEIKSRINGFGCPVCPVCSNDIVCDCGCNSLLKKFPEISLEFDIVKNKITPDKIVFGSRTKYWWICKNNKCGNHIWESFVYNRTINNSGCPFCAKTICPCGCNSITQTHPELLKDWDYNKNKIKPSNIKFGSDIKIWWLCSDCNFEWKNNLNTRTCQGCGCPRCCKKTYSKIAIIWLKYIMKRDNILIQTAESNEGEYKIIGTNMKADGYCKENNTIYEFNGDFWHGNPKIYDKNIINKITGDTMGNLYIKTLKKKKL